ncbi:hypothetical protein [Mangrovitalea sediminis]|uniref:hypothetical protein n=1 Tax=Mangrovitalea sediminis TaxID=1982043 RepID=UPI000BE5AB3D|nr:hypothetical protein [Mangrovitalea sediminis]
MLQLKSQPSLRQVTDLRDKLETQFRPQIDRASKELRRMLKQLGADTEQTHSLSELVSQLRERNPSLKALLLNLDAATYDARKQLSWNAHMLSAYALTKVEETYEQNLKPRLVDYRRQAEDRVKALTDKAAEYRGKVARNADSD